MTDVVLGQIPSPDAKRDATHVAVVPLEAASILYPAQRVVLTDDGRVAPAKDGDKVLGTVDPYLTLPVAPGARPYICLMPRSVVGLRHEYEHPLLDGKADGIVVARAESMDPKEASRRWIEEWGRREYINPDELMAAADRWLRYEDYWVEGGRFEGHPGVPVEFWDHYSVITGEVVPQEKRQGFFSCSC